MKILDGLTADKIQEILAQVDQDQSGSIEFSEFLAHSLTAEHLSSNNIKLFFEVMLPSATTDTHSHTESGSAASPIKLVSSSSEQRRGPIKEE